MRAPSGTVTFLLTDVEGSTQAWQSDSAAAGTALARHEEILAGAIAARGGFRPLEQGEGDSVVAAFGRRTRWPPRWRRGWRWPGSRSRRSSRCGCA